MTIDKRKNCQIPKRTEAPNHRQFHWWMRIANIWQQNMEMWNVVDAVAHLINSWMFEHWQHTSFCVRKMKVGFNAYSILSQSFVLISLSSPLSQPLSWTEIFGSLLTVFILHLSTSWLKRQQQKRISKLRTELSTCNADVHQSHSLIFAVCVFSANVWCFNPIPPKETKVDTKCAKDSMRKLSAHRRVFLTRNKWMHWAKSD